MVQGGDLHEALMDARSGAQGAGLLSWNRQGAKLALDIAKGLESLHARKVSSVTYAYIAIHMFTHTCLNISMVLICKVVCACHLHDTLCTCEH